MNYQRSAPGLIAISLIIFPIAHLFIKHHHPDTRILEYLPGVAGVLFGFGFGTMLRNTKK